MFEKVQKPQDNFLFYLSFFISFFFSLFYYL